MPNASPSNAVRPLSAPVSVQKLHNLPHYETSSGSALGYNESAYRDKMKFFERTWNHHFPAAELLRRNGVAASGYNRLGLSRLYNRSTNVQDVIQDEAGVLGHANVDTYEKILTKGDINTYEVSPDDNGVLSRQYTPIEPYPRKLGSRARINPPRVQSRREASITKSRWQSRHTEEGFVQRTLSRTTNYDTEYTAAHNNTAKLAEARAAIIEPNPLATADRPRLRPSTSLNEQLRRQPTSRAVTHHALWTKAGQGRSWADLHPVTRPHPLNFDLRHHIPSYQKALTTAANPNNLGFRGTSRGPHGQSITRSMWQRPFIPKDTFSSFDSRSVTAMPIPSAK